VIGKFAQYKTLLAKDLRIEFRTKEMLTSMGIYALMVLIVYGASLAQSVLGVDFLQMAGALLWIVIIFSSLLGLNRSFAHEKELAALDGICLVPMDRSIIFLAKMTANVLFLLAILVITVPLFAFFFLAQTQPAATAPLIVLPLFVGTLGFAGIGTLLSTITMHTRGKDVLLAVLFIPLVFPLLYACVSATSLALVGASEMADIWRALALGGAYDVVMILLSWLLYDFIVSS
jgi:heme exporter protein B